METTKQDVQAENKKSNEVVKLIFVSETTGQRRKRNGDVLDEVEKTFIDHLFDERIAVLLYMLLFHFISFQAPPNKKNFSGNIISACFYS